MTGRRQGDHVAGVEAIQPIAWAESGVRVLDQTRLPEEECYLDLRTVDEMAEAIRALRVRGAPLIGIAAALGLAHAAAAEAARGGLAPEWIERAADLLEATRPTAANMKWALTRLRRAGVNAFEAGASASEVAVALRAEAARIWDDERRRCRAIGEAGAGLIGDGATVLTHCNAGVLATGGLGTALGAVYVARQQGKAVRVVVPETRPLRQGARLTAWELAAAGIPARVVVDGAVAAVLAEGKVDLVMTGADRIAANGDVANKIGTYGLAVLAGAHEVPFYVAAPSSTFDLTLASGREIPIERRPRAEVQAPATAEVDNPAFDVTPARYITGLVTEHGVIWQPLAAGIAAVLK